MNWKDTSSYSRGEHGVAEPSVWTAEGLPVRIVVHRFVGHEGWFFSVREMMIEKRQLATTDIENAKAEALARTLTQLESWVKTIKKASELPGEVQK